MPRSNWKGVISFGLVSIPIILFPSKNKLADISFHQIDQRDHSRIKYQRINEQTGKMVPWEKIARGYEYDKDTIIPVPNDVLQKVAGENARTIDIETFIDRKALNVMNMENFYYIVPDKKGDKGYVILREALQDENKVGIAKVIISTKEYLTAVVAQDKALLLCILRYDDEVKKPSEFALPTKKLSAYSVTKKEIDIARKLIQSMSSKWNPKKYVDEYQKAIHQWVDEAVKHIPHRFLKKPSSKANHVMDMMQLLKKSLASNKKVSNPKSDSSRYKAHLKPKSKLSKHLTKHHH